MCGVEFENIFHFSAKYLVHLCHRIAAGLLRSPLVLFSLRKMASFHITGGSAVVVLIKGLLFFFSASVLNARSRFEQMGSLILERGAELLVSFRRNAFSTNVVTKVIFVQMMLLNASNIFESSSKYVFPVGVG